MKSVSRFLSDEQLLDTCRVEQMRGSGPGGQKRNKTSSAVRITHVESGISAVARESRSSHENKRMALRRLRLKLAVELREALNLPSFAPPDWFIGLRHNGRIEASHRHVLFPATAGLILDLLDALHASPSDTATMLGVSTTTIIRFIETEAVLWTAANALRAAAGLSPLTHRR